MTKSTIILALFITVFACQNNDKQIDIANELRGNTFDINFAIEKETTTIEFKDSTCTIFENNNRDLPWRISTFGDSKFLIIEYENNIRSIAIKKRDNNTLDGLLMAKNDYKITLNKREPKWKKDLLIGTWIDNDSNSVTNDSVQKSSPYFIQPPLPPPNYKHKRDFQKYSLYEITFDSVSVKYGYSESKSKIDLNSSIEFLTMNVKSSFNVTEEIWKIKKLTDSIMIVDKTITERDNDFSFTTKKIENIKLIKKR